MIRLLSSTRICLSLRGMEIGAPPYAGGFKGSGFASPDTPGGHYLHRRPHRPIISEPPPREIPKDLPDPFPLPSPPTHPDPYDTEPIEDETRGVEYRYVPPDHMARYDTQWPMNPESVNAVLLPPPGLRNRIRSNRYPRLRLRARAVAQTHLYDGFGNHLFTPWEMWEAYVLAHHTHSLAHSEYIHTAAAFLHYVDRSPHGGAWVPRILSVFNDIRSRGWRWGPWEYTIAIQAYARAGDPEGAEGIYHRMVGDGVAPIQVTYGALMRAYAVLRDTDMPRAQRVARARYWFDEMARRGLVGPQVSFIRVWQGLCALTHHEDEALPPRRPETVLAPDAASRGDPSTWYERRGVGVGGDGEVCPLCGCAGHGAWDCTGIGTDDRDPRRPVPKGWWNASYEVPVCGV